MNLRRLTPFGVALGAMASFGLAAVPASAAQVKAHLVADPTSATIAVGGSTVVHTHLDGCLKVFQNAADKTYGVAIKADDGTVVSIDEAPGVSGQDCDTHNTQTWTIHGLKDGATTVYFDPVVTDNGQGLENQLSGAKVQVTVGTGGGNPPGFERPGAPAIANAHVPHGSALADTCKAAYDGAKNWHGLLIKDVAHWARDNHYNRLKDTYDPGVWESMVLDEVDNHLCV